MSINPNELPKEEHPSYRKTIVRLGVLLIAAGLPLPFAAWHLGQCFILVVSRYDPVPQTAMLMAGLAFYVSIPLAVVATLAGIAMVVQNKRNYSDRSQKQ